MHELMNLKEMLCQELENYGKSRELSPSSLEMIDILAHACKNVCKIIESKEDMGGGSYRDNSYYGGGRAYSRDGYYYDDGGMSTRRGRDRMGRFTSRDGSEMARKLRDMMGEVTDDGLKYEIKKLADKMESM